MLTVLTVKVSRASPTLAAVTFPYDEGLKELVKTVPGRRWDDRLHAWLIPATHNNIDTLSARLPRYARLEIQSELRAQIERDRAAMNEAHSIRQLGDSDISFTYRTEPYAHQRAGLAFLVHLGSGGLLWEMGLGKTKTAIDYAEWLHRQIDWMDQRERQITRVLVICPNTVKRTVWPPEIEKHAGHSDWVVPDGTLPQRARAFGTARYTIVNCEQLSYKVTADALLAIEWDLVIVDESTRFKTPGAKRTKNLHKLKARRRAILTGTPITGKPEDAWSQIEFIGPGTFGTYGTFRNRFLDIGHFKEVKGILPGREKELIEKIDRRSYRVLKQDVLDLPPKVYATRSVELKGEQLTAYKQMRDELRVQIADGPHLTARNVLTMLLRLTQITAGLVGSNETGYRWLPDGAKAAELDDLINDELAGEQVVIFGVYQKELEALADRYAADRYASPGAVKRALAGDMQRPIIYGPTPERVRHELIEQFQAGNRRLLFCQIRTGGIGINLTAAQTAIYVTRSWSLEDWLQSQDRLHRIGQQGTVSIQSLIAQNTIDEEIAKALAGKQELADRLTGDDVRQLAARVLGE